jgi:hypothetical protein
LLKDVTYLFPHIIQNGIEDRYCLPITQKLGIQQATFEAGGSLRSQRGQNLVISSFDKECARPRRGDKRPPGR